MKTCAVCRVPKPLAEFTPRSAPYTGHRTYCLACHAAHCRERYRKHQAALLAPNSTWRLLEQWTHRRTT